MINLIPPPAKKKVVAEYWTRTISLWAILGGTALLLVTTLFIPLNIYVTNQEAYLTTILASREADKSNHEQNSALLTHANEKAEILLKRKYEYHFYELLPLLESIAESKVDLEDVTLNQTKDPVLSVGGIALTRQALVAFRDELEQQVDFLAVDLPISNLIEESDVEFNIKITLATSTPNI